MWHSGEGEAESPPPVHPGTASEEWVGPAGCPGTG